MNKRNVIISLFLAISILIIQVGGVLAAPGSQAFPPIQGNLQKITLETDSSTGISTVILEVRKGQDLQTVRISQETALKLGVVMLDSDGKPVINDRTLGKHVEIDLINVLPEEEKKRHPVADALATFFFESLGTENDEIYKAIMEAHDQGVGFGVIAQVLWLTQEIDGGGDLDDFQILLTAKQSDVYTGLPFEDKDGATITPKNWGELRNAILAGKPIVNLGTVMSSKNNDDNSNNPNNDHENNRDKDKEKNNGNDPNNEKEKNK